MEKIIPQKKCRSAECSISLYISNRVDSIKKGVDLAKDLIDSGKALKQCQLMKGE